MDWFERITGFTEGPQEGWGHHLADPGAGMTQPLVPEHVLDHTAKHHIVTANAPSVLIAQVSDKLRSAPVTLLDQGNGAAPLGVDTRPLVLANPRKSSVPSPGPSGPPRPKRGFTELWLGTRGGTVQPRRGSRAGAFRSHAVLRGVSGEASVSNQIWWLVANPMSWIANDSLW